MRRVLTGLIAVCLLFPALGMAKEEEPPEDFDRTEFGWVPLVGGDTDFGYGAGAMLSLAGFEFGYDPYRYRIQAIGLALFKVTRDWKPLMPFADASFQADFPQLIWDPLRLTVGARYTRSSMLLYPGIGNAARPDANVDRIMNTYLRAEPRAFFSLGIKLIKPWGIKVTGTYTFNVIKCPVAPGQRPRECTPDPLGSSLERDLASSDPLLSGLDGTTNHEVLRLEYQAHYDSRNSELNPTEGMFHALAVQHSPNLGPRLNLHWARINLTGRVYANLFDGRWAFALRGIFDVLVGDAPFYELARAGNAWALGSAFMVRGIPGQRYYGKTKVLANAETRIDMFGFKVGEKRLRVGLVAFADTGRVWADFPLVNTRPDLDSDPAELFKYSFGGGLRLSQGSAFVIRADVAWSPWANPIGFYFGAGHMF